MAHATFGAVGGYTVAYLFLERGVPLLPGLAVGVALSALVGLIVGLPALRLSTEFLILLTLAGQTIILTLVTTNSSLGGTYGLQGLQGFTLFGFEPRTCGFKSPLPGDNRGRCRSLTCLVDRPCGAVRCGRVPPPYAPGYAPS